jgi:hypothetical protein
LIRKFKWQVNPRVDIILIEKMKSRQSQTLRKEGTESGGSF